MLAFPLQGGSSRERTLLLRRTIPALRDVRHPVVRDVRHLSQHGQAARAVAPAGRGAEGPRDLRCRARRARLRHGDHPGYLTEGGRAGRRLHRPRGHLAGDERRRGQADRPPELPGRGHRAAGRSRRGAAAVRDPLPQRADRRRHHHRLGHHPAGRRQQGRRGRDHGRRRVPDGASGDPARDDPHRLHPRRGGGHRHQVLRRAEVRRDNTPTPWTAARAARSSTRASRPTP